MAATTTRVYDDATNTYREIPRPPDASDEFVQHVAQVVTREKGMKRLLQIASNDMNNSNDYGEMRRRESLIRAIGVAGASLLTAVVFDDTLAGQFHRDAKTPPFIDYTILRLPGKATGNDDDDEPILSAEHEAIYEEHQVPGSVMDQLCDSLRRLHIANFFTDVLVKRECLLTPLPVCDHYDQATRTSRFIAAVAIKVPDQHGALVVATLVPYVISSLLNALATANTLSTRSEEDRLYNFSLLAIQLGVGRDPSEQVYYASLGARADQNGRAVEQLHATAATLQLKKLIGNKIKEREQARAKTHAALQRRNATAVPRVDTVESSSTSTSDDDA